MATVLALAVHLDPPEIRERPVSQDNLEARDAQDAQVPYHHLPTTKIASAATALLDPVDLPDKMDHLELLEPRDHLDQLASAETMVAQDPQDLLEPQDSQANLEMLEAQEPQETMEPVVERDFQDQKDQVADQDPRDPADAQDLRDSQETKEDRDLPDPQDGQDPQDSLDNPATRDLRDHPERMPTTALAQGALLNLALFVQYHCAKKNYFNIEIFFSSYETY
jgi:hypothetical protein